MADDNNDNNGKGNNNGKKPPSGQEIFDALMKRGVDNDPARNPASPTKPQRPPPSAADLPMSEEAARNAAARELSDYFNSIANPQNPGLAKLRNDPRYKILDAVWRDDLGDYMTEIVYNRYSSVNTRWLWEFPDEPKDASFLTPAHVVHTHLMAVAMARHKADFNAPDSEGRLPLYYISRYCTDTWLIPYLASQHKVNLSNSGRSARQMNAQISPGQHYEEPILRAIRYGNVYAVEGLIQSVHFGLDLNLCQAGLGQTPLMLAVQAADEAARTGAPAKELSHRLVIVRELVGETSVRLDLKDIGGNIALDYALTDAVRQAWKDGLAVRSQNERRPRPRGDMPPPP